MMISTPPSDDIYPPHLVISTLCSEAEAEFRVCLRMLIGLLGPTHMETIRCMQNLAECLFAQGELQLAETMYRECLEGIELNVGTDHIEVVRTSNSLGVVLEQQGKMVEAKVSDPP